MKKQGGIKGHTNVVESYGSTNRAARRAEEASKRKGIK